MLKYFDIIDYDNKKIKNFNILDNLDETKFEINIYKYF